MEFSGLSDAITPSVYVLNSTSLPSITMSLIWTVTKSQSSKILGPKIFRP